LIFQYWISYVATLFIIELTNFKVRGGLHYENKAFFVVAGIRDDGYREILGSRMADNENSLFW